MGLSGRQSGLLMPPLLVLICLQRGIGLERINYVPQLSRAALAGTLTQSTFTLEQPRGQFSHLNISDFDRIWLVVAQSNTSKNFTVPQRLEDIPVPADFPQRGYYLTMMANRALYPGSQPGNQLQVLRVGNDTHCFPITRGCNHPLPGPGPYRVKFLVMSDRGPVAETEWSNDTRLQQDHVSFLPTRAALPACGVPSCPQRRHSRLPPGSRVQEQWSSLPPCQSCWLFSSPPSWPCSSTPATTPVGAPPFRDQGSWCA